MCRIFTPTTFNAASSNRATIRPASPRATASGLSSTNVRSTPRSGESVMIFLPFGYDEIVPTYRLAMGLRGLALRRPEVGRLGSFRVHLPLFLVQTWDLDVGRAYNKRDLDGLPGQRFMEMISV